MILKKHINLMAKKYTFKKNDLQKVIRISKIDINKNMLNIS